MVDDPYKVLGVSRNATPEQIKSAYRRRSKECHPDLHPDDPDASRKMNDVNEAYDMLTHPEKYAARQASRASQSAYSSESRSSSYAGRQYSSGSSYTNYGQDSYEGQDSYYERQSSYDGPGGWSSDFGDFSFFDMFFGGGASVNTDPVHETYDSREVYMAIEYINRGSYKEAVRALVSVPGNARGARWYYLMSLAQNGSGNSQRAVEYIQKALEMDRNNRVYQSLYNKFARGGRESSPFTYTYTADRRNAYDDDDEDDAYGRGGSYVRTGGLFSTILRVVLAILMFRFMFSAFYSCMFFGF